MKALPAVMHTEICIAAAEVRSASIDCRYFDRSTAASCNCNYCQDFKSHKLRLIPHHISLYNRHSSYLVLLLIMYS
jgi:hypothetical protein